MVLLYILIIGCFGLTIAVEGLIALVIGLFLLFESVTTTMTLVQILGVLWFLGGILSILSLLVDRKNTGWKLLSGIFGVVTGVLVFAYPYTPFVVLSLIVIILGILSIVYGGLRLLWALRGGGLGMAILKFLMIALGILLLINPWQGQLSFPDIRDFPCAGWNCSINRWDQNEI